MNENKLNVLLLSPLPPPAGGIASWTKRYLKWSESSDLNVEIVNTAVTGKRLTKINGKRNLIDEISRTKNIMTILKKKIINNRPNLVHINSSCGKFGIIRDYLFALLIKEKGIRIIVHYRCNIEDQIGKKNVQLFFFKKLAKAANLNLVLNTPSKEFLEKETRCSSTLVPNFIDDSFQIKKNRKINNSVKKILFVGHVQKTKGAIEIIETAKYFPDFTFTLAGPVSNEISQLNLPKNIELIGEINKSKVIDLLDESDIFLFPSYTEGFANALLEAMAMGLPVIATGVGANLDMLENHGGIIVQKKKHQDIVKAIKKLENKHVREKMSIWNIEKVHSHYFIDSVMEQLIELYRAEIK